ncbi:ABC transporter substrate-binding protein [Ruania alba]|uniref:Peptide/nickel transport system substrate-binding protein n=1 Tax=Ruania alba TaxID=648782 RepID=A0A1H5NGK7_9MICO|nr:ABC transporter substrate-binding protein [Ruania alba]SEF00733.1 peptide/nickel transport system substrate-binding protein [Ruania alba]
MFRSTRRTAIAVGLAGSLALVGCTGGNTANQGSDGNETTGASDNLVIDTAFSLETGDPGRNYVPTGNMVLHAVYDTLLTFEGSAEAEPVPSLATVEQNEDATEFTFTLDGERTFSDGSTVDADDVVYSLTRVQGMTESKANFLMTGITVEKVDDLTVRLTTESPSLQLPAIMTNPALSILNSEVVQANGGTTGTDDAAEEFLNGESVGSGPYLLDSLDLTTQVVLTANPEYDGDTPPAYERIVIRNVSESATQLINLQGGDSQLAVDLNGDQVAGLGEEFTVTSVPSAETIFLLINQDAEVGGATANPDFAEAVRYAVDTSELLELAGAGAEAATGVIPPMFPGSLADPIGQDLARAEQALDASGYDGETLRLQFPNDYPVGGVEFTPVAERLQSQLQEAGITVELAPAPFATEIDPYVTGQEAFSMWFWGPDFADSSSFLPFGPGEKVGLRAGWTAEDAPEIAELTAAATTATDTDEREQAMSDYATAMQESGPFVPLLVPGVNLAGDDSVTNIEYNSTWTLDIRLLAPAS